MRSPTTLVVTVLLAVDVWVVDGVVTWHSRKSPSLIDSTTPVIAVASAMHSPGLL